MESHKPVDVTKLSDQEAIDYFFDKGVPLWYFKELKVGVEGLSPDEKHHFGEALNGHLGMLYTHTPAGHQLAESIISYLQGVLGYETKDIKKTATQQNWAHGVAKGHSMSSWWLYPWDTFKKWWFILRDKRK